MKNFRKLMLVAASAMVLANVAPASAQNPSFDKKYVGENVGQVSEKGMTGMEATEIIGARVMSSENEDIGEVKNLIVAQSGEIHGAVIDVGGFLGVGEKSVLVPMERLKIEKKDGNLVVMLDATKDELTSAEAFDESPWKEYSFNEMNKSKDQAQSTTTTEPATKSDQKAETTTSTDSGQQAQSSDTATTTDSSQQAQSSDTATTTDSNQQAQSTESTATTTDSSQQAQSSDTATTTDSSQQAQTTQPSTDQQAQTTQQSTDQQATTTVPKTNEGQGQLGQVDLQGKQLVEASTLMGKTVYSANDENVGDINDILFSSEGQMVGVIVGVGGFLGLGEKNVLVPFDRFKINATDNNDAKIVLDTTKEELEGAPAYDEGMVNNAPNTNTNTAN